MGMKANSGHFLYTNGYYKNLLVLNMQFFAEKKISKHGATLLKKVTDERLKNTIRELYRPGSKIGDGGTADAIKYELKHNCFVGGKSHIIKGKERVANLKHFLDNKNISKKDRKIAEKLLNNLEKALGVKNGTKRIK